MPGAVSSDMLYNSYIGRKKLVRFLKRLIPEAFDEPFVAAARVGNTPMIFQGFISEFCPNKAFQLCFRSSHKTFTLVDGVIGLEVQIAIMGDELFTTYKALTLRSVTECVDDWIKLMDYESNYLLVY